MADAVSSTPQASASAPSASSLLDLAAVAGGLYGVSDWCARAAPAASARCLRANSGTLEVQRENGVGPGPHGPGPRVHRGHGRHRGRALRDAWRPPRPQCFLCLVRFETLTLTWADVAASPAASRATAVSV